MSDPTWTLAAVSAVAAVASGLVAFFAARFSWLTLLAMGEPKVIVYVKHDNDRPTLICIVIENIGKDVAEDVSFTLSRKVPREAFGMPGAALSPTKLMEDGPLVDGIPALGPGAPRVITWGQYAGLRAALGGKPIDIKIEYRHGKRRLHGSTRLEVESFGYSDASETPTSRIANSTKKVAEELHRATVALERIQGDVHALRRAEPNADGNLQDPPSGAPI